MATSYSNVFLPQKLPNVTIEYSSISQPNENNVPLSEMEYLLPCDDKWEFSRSNLILRHCIGEGEFGKVVFGEALGIVQENITTTVAVKMLKGITN